MTKYFLLLILSFSIFGLFAQEDMLEENKGPLNHAYGGLFVGYSGVLNKQPAISFQAFYDRKIVPYLSIEAGMGYIQAWDEVKDIDTLSRIGVGFFKTAVAAQFVYPKRPKNHVMKASFGPSMYFGFITRLFDDDPRMYEVIPPQKRNISAGIAGTIQYHYILKKNISIGVVTSWDYVFQKKNFFGNVMPGISVGARF